MDGSRKSSLLPGHRPSDAGTISNSCVTLDKLLLPLQIAIINALKNLYAGGRKWGEGKEEGTFAELNAKKEKTYKYSCKSFFFFFFLYKHLYELSKESGED